jgi:hypothetical protein
MAFTREEQSGLLVEIAEIVNMFTPRQKVKTISGDDLSYYGVRLAALKASVVDLKVDAEQDYLNGEVQADEARARAYLDAKKEHGATAAGEAYKIDPEYVAARLEADGRKVEFNRLKSILSDVHDLIESLTGRMIELHGARKDERVG